MPQLTAAPITTSTSATTSIASNNSTSNEFISRQEFDAYRVETNLKIEELTQQLSELFSAQKSHK